MSAETDSVAVALGIDPTIVTGLTNDPNTGALVVLCSADPGISQENIVVEIAVPEVQ